jgi:hypothetical protein
VSTLRLEYVAIEDLLAAPRNPNAHNLPAIAESIRRHGFVEPVIRDDRTGFLLGGHGRVEVVAEMRDGGESPPDGITARWEVPAIVGWSSRSDAEAEALLLAMVNLTKQPISDTQLLASMLSDLAQDPDGLLGTGYDDASLDLLLASLAQDDAMTDPNSLWNQGGPEYQQGERRAAFQTMVNFLTREDAIAFWEQVFGTREIRTQAWWPEHDGLVGQTEEVEWIARPTDDDD